MSLEALIFDVDGTLADTEEAHRQAFNAAFASHGLPWHWSSECYAELLKTTGGKERIAAYIGTLDVPSYRRAALRARIPEIHRTKVELYAGRVRDGSIALRQGVRRLLDEGRAGGVRLAIASTTTRDSIDALLTNAVSPDAISWFAVIATGDEVPNKKPAPDIYEAVLRALRVRPDDCVAFEDSGRGLAAAKGAGLFAIVTPTRWTRDDDFRAADLVLSCFGDRGQPLSPEDAALVGNSMLTLHELERLLARRRRTGRGARAARGVVTGRVPQPGTEPKRWKAPS